MRLAPALVLLCSALAAVPASGSQPHRRSSGQTHRRRLFTSPLITTPGGIDLEFSSVFDPRGGFTLPATLKYTPSSWHTEFSAGIDAGASLVDENGDRATHFSDHLNLAATTAFSPTDNFSWAFAPTAAIFLRGGDGFRLGGTVIARYDRGNNTVGASTSWSGATNTSPNNPSGIFDLIGGYGRKFGRLTPYANIQLERASGISMQYSLFEGIEWQFNARLSFDLSVQHYALNSTQPENHCSVGLTYSLK
ncbi:MAG: hypothetical protein Q7U75_09710 [Desulfobacterales bacterium]|nr:hypothetical protein [Desulfobacterales bacterium]